VKLRKLVAHFIKHFNNKQKANEGKQYIKIGKEPKKSQLKQHGIGIEVTQCFLEMRT
jgi:hypothetical protein